MEGAWESLGADRTLAKLEMWLAGKMRTDLSALIIPLKGRGGDDVNRELPGILTVGPTKLTIQDIWHLLCQAGV